MLHFYEIDSFGEVKSLGKAMKCVVLLQSETTSIVLVILYRISHLLINIICFFVRKSSEYEQLMLHLNRVYCLGN